METKITFKAGTVLADGTAVGTVEKVTHEGLWADSYGIRVNGSEWVGTAPDGAKFSGRTRKEVASRLAAHAQPLKVTGVKVEDTFYGCCITATVSWQGNTAFVSQHPDEDYWVVDAYFTHGCPHWSNGTGSRYTTAHALKAEYAAAVDAAVEAASLTLENAQ